MRDVRLAAGQRVAPTARGSTHDHEVVDLERELGVILHDDAQVGEGPERDERQLARSFACDPREQRGRGFVDRPHRCLRTGGVAEAVIAVNERRRAQVGCRQQRTVRADGNGYVVATRRVHDAQHVRRRDLDGDIAPYDRDRDDLERRIHERPPQRDGVVDATVGVDYHRPRHGVAPQASRLSTDTTGSWHDHGKLIHRSVCAHTYSGTMIDQGL